MITGMIIGALAAIGFSVGIVSTKCKINEEIQRNKENAEAPKPPITKKKREKREESTIDGLICWTIVSFFLLPPAFPAFLLALIFKLKEKKNKQKQ